MAEVDSLALAMAKAAGPRDKEWSNFTRAYAATRFGQVRYCCYQIIQSRPAMTPSIKSRCTTGPQARARCWYSSTNAANPRRSSRTLPRSLQGQIQDSSSDSELPRLQTLQGARDRSARAWRKRRSWPRTTSFRIWRIHPSRTRPLRGY